MKRIEANADLDKLVFARDIDRMADVGYTAEAVVQFLAFPKTIQMRLRKVATRLANWPDVSGAKPLTGNLAGWYRIRTGDYRVRFYVKGDDVVIDRIGHRKDVYD